MSNGLSKLTAAKSIPIILKRCKLNTDKNDCCSESNENIDENKKGILKSNDDRSKDLVQRSSSRKVNCCC